jgi:hypothetical protein
VRVVRSSSAFGFSMINVIFEDNIDLLSRSQTSFALRRRARLTPLASTCRPSRLRQGSRRATVASSGQAGGEGTPDERYLLTIGAANCGTQAAR